MKDIREHDFYNDSDFEEEHGISIWQAVAMFMASQAAALGVIEWIIR